MINIRTQNKGKMLIILLSVVIGCVLLFPKESIGEEVYSTDFFEVSENEVYVEVENDFIELMPEIQEGGINGNEDVVIFDVEDENPSLDTDNFTEETEEKNEIPEDINSIKSFSTSTYTSFSDTSKKSVL